MRIRTIKTTNTVQYAIIKDLNKNGKRTTCIYENLGTLDKIKLRAGNEEPLVWLDNYVKELKTLLKLLIKIFSLLLMLGISFCKTYITN